MTRCYRLGLGNRRTQHDVTQESGWGLKLVGPGAQLIHRKTEHISGARLVEPLQMQLFHGAHLIEQDVDLRIGMNAQGIKGKDRHAMKPRLIYLKRCLIIDFDAHRLRSRRDRVRSSNAV
ncbi:unannotated protein [freshwater metagenome]|uniref:Unannotated protein n=1 Tax=freshwater metagenome TaxID=449393 RepID=A0A6J7FN15_9ZZZZ